MREPYLRLTRRPKQKSNPGKHVVFVGPQACAQVAAQHEDCPRVCECHYCGDLVVLDPPSPLDACVLPIRHDTTCHSAKRQSSRQPVILKEGWGPEQGRERGNVSRKRNRNCALHVRQNVTFQKHEQRRPHLAVRERVSPTRFHGSSSSRTMTFFHT